MGNRGRRDRAGGRRKRTRSVTSRRFKLVMAALCVVLALGIWGAVKIWTLAFNVQFEPDFLGPNSIADFVSSADVIAKGTIVEHGQDSFVFPPPGTPPPVGTVGLPTTTWFSIRETVDIVELLKDDGVIGQSYEVSIPGTVPTNPLEWAARERSVSPVGRTGDTYLDFLANDPYSSEYALRFAPHGRVRLSGDTVTFSDRTPVLFAEGMTPDEFYQAVKEEVALQGRLPSPAFPAVPGVSR